MALKPIASVYQLPASCAQELSFKSDTAKASRKGGGLELHGVSRKGGAATVLYQKQLAGDGLHKERQHKIQRLALHSPQGIF